MVKPAAVKTLQSHSRGTILPPENAALIGDCRSSRLGLILCQITSRAHWNSFGVPLDNSDVNAAKSISPASFALNDSSRWNNTSFVNQWEK